MTSGSPVLVTGGAGYIGSHCCKSLMNDGLMPVCFDNLSTGRRDFARYGPLVVGDIRDSESLDFAFETYQPTAVMHFAALIEVEESVRKPLDYYDVNLGGTLHLLNACRRHGIEQFVFSSTAAVYGAPQSSPVGLEAPKIPINPYGESKLMAEKLLGDCAGETGIRTTVFRYFNAAGADPEGELGMRFRGASHIIPRLLTAAANGTPFSIYGTDYPTPDGTCIRDYIHVSDLADAHTAALVRPPASGAVNTYNIGVGKGYSVRDVIDSVERVTGRNVVTEINDRRPGDPPSLVAGDTEITKSMLNWAPKFDHIDSIVSHGAAWRAIDQQS